MDELQPFLCTLLLSVAQSTHLRLDTPIKPKTRTRRLHGTLALGTSHTCMTAMSLGGDGHGRPVGFSSQDLMTQLSACRLSVRSGVASSWTRRDGERGAAEVAVNGPIKGILHRMVSRYPPSHFETSVAAGEVSMYARPMSTSSGTFEHCEIDQSGYNFHYRPHCCSKTAV
jgi:hypothetical protein